MKVAVALLAGAALVVPAWAAPVAVMPAIALEQGGVYRGTLPAGSRGLTLDGKPVALAADGGFIFGVGRDAPALATLGWRTAAGEPATRPVTVAPRQWPVQSLPTLPPRPVPDAEYEARRPGEIVTIAAARDTVSALAGWRGGFVRPADGPVTGVYGSQRILAGTPSTPHFGVDFGAAAGSPVRAPAAGVVRLAYGPFTLEGNLVMIDHGMGLVSALLHLSRIDVAAGDVVAAGQVIGAVGQTGRATGPHLHWGLTWTDVRVDPAGLLKDAN